MINLRALAIQPIINEAFLPRDRDNRNGLILEGFQRAIETNVRTWILGGLSRDEIDRSYNFMVLTADRMLTENHIHPEEVRVFLNEQKLNE